MSRSDILQTGAVLVGILGLGIQNLLSHDENTSNLLAFQKENAQATQKMSEKYAQLSAEMNQQIGRQNDINKDLSQTMHSLNEAVTKLSTNQSRKDSQSIR